MADINAPLTDPNAALEQVSIDQYLEFRGQTRQSVRTLDEGEAFPMLKAASDYASLRLAVIESRAHYVDQIHK
jgi:hypothetical protein